MVVHQARLLIEGRETANVETVFRRLVELDIETRTFAHPPAFNLEEFQTLRGEIPGTHLRHLFVHDQRQRPWLVACAEDTKVDLQRLGQALRGWRLSFGSVKELMLELGVIPGSISLFAVLNDPAQRVRVAIDRTLLERRPWNIHPLDNGLTTSIDPEDMLLFLDAERHEPELIDLV